MTNEIQITIWALLTTLEKKETVYTELQGAISKTAFEKEFLELIKKGFVNECLGDLIIEKKWFPLVKNITSVELKLHDFNGAFKQAERYSNYSNFTFIGMPEEKCKRLSEDKLDQLKKNNIGLLAFKEQSSTIIEWVKPKRKKILPYAKIAHTRIAEIFWKDISQTI